MHATQRNIVNASIDFFHGVKIDFQKHKETINVLKIDDENMERVDHYKYLGVMLDSKLSFFKSY